MKINQQLANELNLSVSQVNNVINLIDEGNTIPFIARYRKEVTGSLYDEVLRLFDERLKAIRALENRRLDIIRLITELDQMTPEILKQLDEATTLTELDDIYRPFRPKRRTRATIAKEKGLEPLALLILAQEKGFDPELAALNYLSVEHEVNDVDQALAYSMDIIAEIIADDANYRKVIRKYTYDKGMITSKNKKDEDSVYRLYYQYQEAVIKIPSHRLLAINRGEKEDYLTVKIVIDEEWIINYLNKKIIKDSNSKSAVYLKLAIQDAYKRLLASSIQNEIRSLLTEQSAEKAISVFKENLRSLLLTPPVHNKVVMGFDPAYRTGCKIAIVDGLGNVLATTVVYPTPPQSKIAEAKQSLLELITKHHVDIIAIGNGTASKESEIFIVDLIKESALPLSYIMINEAGASVYSASKLAQNELPKLDVSLRSAVSIARRFQDPLAELVKIDPKAIGVGQYQHDMNTKQLNTSLDGVVESCVNAVGAELNTASVALLSHIAGISSSVATKIVAYRQKTPFTNRFDLLNVSGIKEKTFVQCAGFLRVYASNEFLDNTAVHPESYQLTKALLAKLDYQIQDVKDHRLNLIDDKITAYGIERLAKELDCGLITLKMIVDELKKPGRDPRDELPQPILRSDIMDISYLKPGMVLIGTVRNVADFGAFVDIGVHQDGLVHISKLSKNFVKRALDEVSVGDIIKVRVLEVDVDKKRISLERVFD
ncbi:MAG: Tex family protein [Erysipelotrichaceae bacterium]|nr:Tex family protein [Erysipelotrichaceae bacterium]